MWSVDVVLQELLVKLDTRSAKSLKLTSISTNLLTTKIENNPAYWLKRLKELYDIELLDNDVSYLKNVSKAFEPIPKHLLGNHTELAIGKLIYSFTKSEFMGGFEYNRNRDLDLKQILQKRVASDDRHYIGSHLICFSTSVAYPLTILEFLDCLIPLTVYPETIVSLILNSDSIEQVNTILKPKKIIMRIFEHCADTLSSFNDALIGLLKAGTTTDIEQVITHFNIPKADVREIIRKKRLVSFMDGYWDKMEMLSK